MSNFAPPSSAPLGRVVSQASSSQYGWQGGQSACTAICLMAAQGLLELHPSEWTNVPSILMDLWVQQGIAKFNLLRSNAGGSFDAHASVEDLWPNTVLADFAESHVLATTIQGSVAIPGNLRQAFQGVLLSVTGLGDHSALAPPPDGVAVVWTKSGETILCLGTTLSFRQRCPTSPPFWYVFDSHGLTRSTNKVATLRELGDLDELLDFLQQKYPALVMGNTSSLQEDMYNLFEANPIVRKHPIVEAAPQNAPANNMEDWIQTLITPSNPFESPQSGQYPIPNQNVVLTPRNAPLQNVAKASPYTRTSTVVAPPQPQQSSTPNPISIPTSANPFDLFQPQQSSTPNPISPPAAVNPFDFIQPQQSSTPNPTTVPPPSNVPLQKAAKATAPATTTTATPQATNSAASSSAFLIQRTDYEDPITYQIMADPVSCDDGHSYDRPVIERCFRDRIAAEEARLRGSNQPGHDATNCCGANQAPIELVSPISNKVVSGNLIPNLFLEQQIVRLMESNHFNLSQEDLADWHRRREEKRVSDRQREENERQERLRAEERRRNAEEAEARNRAAGHQGNPSNTFATPAPVVEPPPSLTSVRLVRDTSDPNQRRSNMDTGLAVLVGESGSNNVVTPEFFTQLGREVRCMVDRCTRRLDGAAADRRCARCTRFVCADCLAFDVSSFARLSVDHRLHTVCLDCMCQIVDCMDPNVNSPLGQKRAALSRELEAHMARFTNRAAVLQERTLRLDVTLRNAPQISQRDQEKAQLKETLVDLYSQIDEANHRAETAKNDAPISPDFVQDGRRSDERQPGTPTTTDNSSRVQELQALCEELEEEFAEALKESVGDEEDDQIHYVENISRLTALLDKARLDLAMASSNSSEQSSEQTYDTSPTTNCIHHLRASCQSLEVEFLAAVADTPDENDDEAKQILYVERISRLEHQLNQARMNLAMAESTESCSDSGTGTVNSRAGSERFSSRIGTSMPATARVLLSQSNISPPTCPIPVGPLTATINPSGADTGDPYHQTVLFIQRVERSLEANKRRVGAAFQGRTKKEQMRTRSKWLDDLRWSHAAVVASPLHTEQQRQTLVTLMSQLDSARDLFTFTKASEMGWKAARAEIAAIASTVGEQSAQQNSTRDHLDSNQPPGYWEKKDLLAVTQDATASSVLHIQLPLGLEFPTQRTQHQLEILRNTLALRRVECEQAVEEEWTEYWTARDGEVDALEKAITEARQQLSTSESTAREEEKRAREREEERRRREEERRAREEARRAEQARVERERAILQERVRRDEAATERVFARAASQGANVLGGRGDLRMCGRCKAGPFENQACGNLNSHNLAETQYGGVRVTPKARPNACPNCDWFDGEWTNWPPWDGTYGPH